MTRNIITVIIIYRLPLQQMYNSLISDYVTGNGCGGLKRAFMMNEKTEGGKSDERRVIKGKRTESEDYLTSVWRESASYLIMDK